jgi:hypothetical protein
LKIPPNPSQGWGVKRMAIVKLFFKNCIFSNDEQLNVRHSAENK